MSALSEQLKRVPTGSDADALWAGGANRDELAAIAADPASDDLTRLGAAEVLFAHDYPRDALAEVYVRALTIPSVEVPANHWGFLFYAPDADGPLGEHLLATGPAAIPSLLALLDDDTALSYAGSRDAMLGNSFHYRVKDAAGYFLAKLTGVDIPFHEDPGERDEELTRLRAAVAGDG